MGRMGWGLRRKKKDMPGGLWTKCKGCSAMIYTKEFAQNAHVCPKCGFHHTVNARTRIEITADPGTFAEKFTDLSPRDRLGFAALDYAAAHGHARAVAVLLDADAACACDRARAAALARRAGFAGVAATLDAAAARAASTRTDRDKLRRWVESIGCGAFFDRLLALGYDFALVAEQGLDAADVEALGIPADKPGLAKKLRTRHRFPFAGGSAASGGGSDEDDGASDDEGEDESGSDDDDESSGSGSGSEES